jgi:hypothetical protein
VAIAATRFLERSGYRVLLVDKQCCGRPMIYKGMLSQAKENAAWNVDKLAPYAEKEIPIVGLEPSCLLTLRDEYPEFIRTNTAKKVAANSFLLEEFVQREQAADRLTINGSGNSRKVLLHGHCHQKALVGTAPTSRCSKPQASKSAKSIPAAAAWRAPSALKKNTTISRSPSATAGLHPRESASATWRSSRPAFPAASRLIISRAEGEHPAELCGSAE